SSIEFARL
nr:Chain P, Glycoprotein B [Herpes simplex virus unknown type]1RJY_Q Chain Q, Glycoprotein B [Herpes simplex virus unknown type]1RK0_P Chain P, Glycoprotein B [synthetic construct]1T0M_P Chain P, Glycoprotein B [synthetic construct]1T0M_Q Chain Q, Glycoprotein B [synthetic construct]1T0N_P Chain P, Glycoprotein B [synthetic construct]1T0N_Q Chain Q, Glycoprotein B [synthetic construct]